MPATGTSPAAWPPAKTPSSPASGFDSNQLAALALQHIEGLGSRLLSGLLQQVDSPLALLDGELDLATIAALKPKARKALLGFLREPRASRAWELAERSAEWLSAAGAELLLRSDSDYPEVLAELPDSPSLLYLLGNRSLLDERSLSIVGARKPSGFGDAFTEQLASELSQAGLVIVSGMAKGIDSAAHRGALQASGATVAVWAAGLDQVYPPSSTALAEAIAHQGVIVSEMPLGTPPVGGLFPRRNRIVAGLSDATLVVEAESGSGSLITANFALEQNREVMAVPGRPGSSTSAGCHQLIREGATLVESAADVLQALGGFRSLPLASDQQMPAAELPAELQQVLAALAGEALPAEVLQTRTGLPIEQLNQCLIDLELQGCLVHEAGFYSLIGR